MSQTEKAMHKMLSEHEKTLKDYVDPWGLRGGLFGAAIFMFIFALAVYTDGVDIFEFGTICLAIAASGYAVSRFQSLINMLNAMNDIDSKTIIVLHETVRKQEEIIKSLESKK